MDRSWVISELIRLERRSLPEFTFWKRNKTPASAPAAPTDVALLPAAADDDAVTIRKVNDLFLKPFFLFPSSP